MKRTYTERHIIIYPDLVLPKQTKHLIGKYEKRASTIPKTPRNALERFLKVFSF